MVLGVPSVYRLVKLQCSKQIKKSSSYYEKQYDSSRGSKGQRVNFNTQIKLHFVWLIWIAHVERSYRFMIKGAKVKWLLSAIVASKDSEFGCFLASSVGQKFLFLGTKRYMAISIENITLTLISKFETWQMNICEFSTLLVCQKMKAGPGSYRQQRLMGMATLKSHLNICILSNSYNLWC